METAAETADETLVGAEIAFGATLIGHVLGVVRDPHSQRVRWLITAYGPNVRRVAVPVEWIVRQTAQRVELAVGARSLDDLPEQLEVWRGPPLQPSRPARATKGA